MTITRSFAFISRIHQGSAQIWVAANVFELIEGIYETQPEQSRALLRNRITLSQEPSLFERELIKVCAKRFEVSDQEFETAWRNQCTGLTPKIFVLEASEKSYPRFLPIEAWILDSEKKLIAHAWNTASPIRTQHAEMNLIKDLKKRGMKIPKDSILVSTLKPCAMCAAKIWEEAQDLQTLQVVYLQDDPGPYGQNTILTQGSPARMRFIPQSSPLFHLKIQFSADELSREFLLSLMPSQSQVHELSQ